MNSIKQPEKHTQSGKQESLLSSPSQLLLQKAIHHKTMKTPDHNKYNKTKKYNPNSNYTNTNTHSDNIKNTNTNARINNKGNTTKSNKNKHNKKTRYSLKKHPEYPEYLEKLIRAYYDNDECVNKYLSTAHRKLHKLPPARRIIVIGDIHGDFDAAVKCLVLGRCIAPIEPPDIKTTENMDIFFKSLEWIGGDTHVVQLGDQIDRVRPRSWDRNSISQTAAPDDEGSTLEIFYLFWYINQLAQQSKPNPGAVHCIIGNHEIMNVEGDFSYVSSAEFNSFKNHLSSIYCLNSKYPYDSRTLKNIRNTRIKRGLPMGYRERLYAFSPTGLCANFMAQNYYTLLQIGNWLFCHGSPTAATLATYEIDLINTITSMYLLGLEAPPPHPSHPPPGNDVSSSSRSSIEYHFDKIMNNDLSDRIPSSLIWSRTFGDMQSELSAHELSTMLDTILATYNKKNNNTNAQNIATHIAIGHTPQITDNKQLGINSICNGRAWRCDVAMSKAFNTHANTHTNTNTHANTHTNTNTHANTNLKNMDINNTKNRKIQVLEILDNNPRIISGF